MQLRAIIIDDEQKGIDTLKLLMEKFVEGVKIVAETSRPELAAELIESYKPEIVFLDINMPGMNGFELLEKLQWKEFNLVFTTAHEEFAIRALKNNAVDYLLKPIDHEDLRHAIDRIMKQISENNERSKYNYESLLNNIQFEHKQRVVINSKFGVEAIDVKDILYLESQSNYTKLFLVDRREIITTRILKDFEATLCDKKSDFMRIHNSFIINLSKVERYLKSEELIVMSNNQKIPLAKSRKESFFEWMKV